MEVYYGTPTFYLDDVWRFSREREQILKFQKWEWSAHALLRVVSWKNEGEIQITQQQTRSNNNNREFSLTKQAKNHTRS